VLAEKDSHTATVSDTHQHVVSVEEPLSSTGEQMNQLRAEKATVVDVRERAYYQEIELSLEEASKNHETLTSPKGGLKVVEVRKRAYYQEIELSLEEASRNHETLSSPKGGLKVRTSDHQDTNIELDSLFQELEEANTPSQAESRDEHDPLSALEVQKAELESQILSINEVIPVLADIDPHAPMLTHMHRQATSLQKQLSSTEEQMNQLRAEKETTVVEERERTYHQKIQLSLEGASRTLAALRSKKGDVLAATIQRCSRDSPRGKSRISPMPPRVRFSPTQRTKGPSYE
jgi:hypothetical protein